MTGKPLEDYLGKSLVGNIADRIHGIEKELHDETAVYEDGSGIILTFPTGEDEVVVFHFKNGGALYCFYPELHNLLSSIGATDYLSLDPDVAWIGTARRKISTEEDFVQLLDDLSMSTPTALDEEPQAPGEQYEVVYPIQKLRANRVSPWIAALKVVGLMVGSAVTGAALMNTLK